MQYPVTIDYRKLLENLLIEKIHILVGIKPDAEARSTWNRAMQAIVDTLPENKRARVKAMFMEVTI
jgi:hypothetical protein